MTELPPQYQPHAVEERLYQHWESEGLFRPCGEQGPTGRAEPYTIVIPPPNVTGILHMGHALNNTIQDILIRWKRMQGHPTLWVPGTDHAGIATQNVVEKALAKEGRHRQDLGREAFVQRVWRWKAEYGNTIIGQLKRLGASCDWSRTRFTMDDGLSRAVNEVFVRLYEEGLIYRGNYIVNWCPRCETALSDEEAPYKPVEGKLYYIRYPVVSSERSVQRHRRSHAERLTLNSLVVATTRPETMLGDTAIAVNPQDKRYRALIGKEAILPLVGRRLKIIADDFVDPKFGTGAVKVTPAHDPNDFAIAQRHQLPVINIMTPTAQMENVPPAYLGKDRLLCRQTVLEDLQQEGLLDKQEAYQHNVGHCYRCDTMIEPRLSLQWFVRMQPLAQPAIQAVKTGKIRFHPPRWTKVYLHWMTHIRDWCISRQIWWGHRIPVYYCDKCLATTGMRSSEPRVQSNNRTHSELSTLNSQRRAAGVMVSRTPPTECPHCHSRNVRQDEDVLDTWFSSWLWPFSTLGWPQQTSDLTSFYPTSTLVTAPEIIFFWVARMIMAGLHFMGKVPFRDVYIHGTVRDLTGKKMSKSLGNIIDPLDIINEFGCDALRFSLVSATAVGSDVFIGDEKFLVGRNFANKLWNATRFALGYIHERRATSDERRLDPHRLDLADRWILSRLQDTIQQTTRALEQYRFNDAAHWLYEFIWHEFCDWYLELAKDKLAHADPETRAMTVSVLVQVLKHSLRLLHPLMPFITDELWHHLHERQSIMVAPWPTPEKRYVDRKAEQTIALMQQVIMAVRNIRATFRIAPTQPLHVYCATANADARKTLEATATLMAPVAGVAQFEMSRTKRRLAHAATALVDHVEVSVPLAGVIDLAKERARLQDQRRIITQQLAHLKQRLRNRAFLTNAPADVVAKERERATTLEAQRKALTRSLAILR